jgi:hypothetical protein
MPPVKVVLYSSVEVETIRLSAHTEPTLRFLNYKKAAKSSERILTKRALLLPRHFQQKITLRRQLLKNYHLQAIFSMRLFLYALALSISQTTLMAKIRASVCAR